MKQFNFADENCKECKICKALIEKHIDKIDVDDYRALILEVVALTGAKGINLIKEVLKDADIDLQPFDRAIAKLINQLLGFDEL